MQITKRTIGLTVNDSLMRVYVAAPQTEGQYPGILFYSDIYQLGRPITVWADRLAGYGYVVAAPEIFHRLEPIGTVIEPNDLGRLQGNDDARRTEIAEYDADAQAVLDWLAADNSVNPDRLGTFGFCIGGHLALRAGLQTTVKGIVSIYPTGIHSGKLGRGTADTIDRLGELPAELLIIFGSEDPHVPTAGREKILSTLDQAPGRYKSLLYPANHTFMRDDGYRYDPVCADRAWQEIITFLNQVFGQDNSQ